jgi:hypothetical protein
MKDATGKRLRVGDMVRICGVPDLAPMTTRCRRESEPVFRYLVGKRKRISRIDELGNARIEFRMKSAGKTTYHEIGIEPQLLNKITTEEDPEQGGGRVR